MDMDMDPDMDMFGTKASGKMGMGMGMGMGKMGMGMGMGGGKVPAVDVEPAIEEEAAAVGDPHMQRLGGETTDLEPSDLSLISQTHSELEDKLLAGLEEARANVAAS